MAAKDCTNVMHMTVKISKCKSFKQVKIPHKITLQIQLKVGNKQETY